MDVEVMVAADGMPKVIEIDARLPSQTPAACSTQATSTSSSCSSRAFARPAGPGRQRPPRPCAAPSTSTCWSPTAASQVLGEHIVGAAGPLRRCDGLLGADVVLTDGPDSGAAQGRWVAVLMTRGATAAAARGRAAAAVARLAYEHGLELVTESEPALATP